MKKRTLFGVTWRPRNHFTGDDDATISNVTALSRPAEWHALGVGALVGAAIAVALAMGVPIGAVLAAGGAGGVGFGAGRALEHLRSSAHVRDALREPAYAAIGLVIGYPVGLVAITAARLVRVLT